MVSFGLCNCAVMQPQEEREDILEALSRDVPLDDTVDFKAVAEKCQDFSGADLKAVLYNAQLQAAHEALRRKQEIQASQEEEALDTAVVLPESVVIRNRRGSAAQAMVFRWTPSGAEKQEDPHLEEKVGGH